MTHVTLNSTMRGAAVWMTGLALAIALVGVSPSRAHAYSWMIRHGYTGCATCHADPSGGGLLTAYGRAQGTLLMSSRFDRGEEDDEAVARRGEFLFGAIPLPETVLAGGDVRAMAMAMHVNNTATQGKFIFMQGDLGAAVQVDRVHAQGTLGIATDGAVAATIAGSDEARLVSRTHWVGFDLGEDHNILIRAGRMNLPFGVRTIEHTSWVRSATRTDTNAAQQAGVAIAYSGTAWRGEFMGIVGNLQLSPDEYRERGYSAYIEYMLGERVAVGASSLIAHAARDVTTLEPMWRHAHGLFARIAFSERFSLLAEADYILQSRPTHNAYGATAWSQLDFEAIQGLHLMATLECADRDWGNTNASFGEWASVAWFFLPHLDVRVDGVLQQIGVPGMTIGAQSVLVQLHGYL